MSCMVKMSEISRKKTFSQYVAYKSKKCKSNWDLDMNMGRH